MTTGRVRANPPAVPAADLVVSPGSGGRAPDPDQLSVALLGLTVLSARLFTNP